MKYLCVFDMDGTLLNSSHLIPEKNKEAIKALKDKGVGVVLATGRTELMTRKYVQEMGIDLPVISNNGALVIDAKTRGILYQNTFSVESLAELIKYSIAKDKDYFIYTIDKVYYSPDSKKIKIMHLYNSMVSFDEKIELVILPSKTAEVLSFLPNGGADCVFKFLISDQADEDFDFLDPLEGVDAVSSQIDSLDVMPTGSSKANALAFLVEYLGIDRRNVFAFGDNYNDMTMLDYAAHAIVPCNGVEEAKAIADFVTVSNDDAGVSQGIFEYVIPRLSTGD